MNRSIGRSSLILASGTIVSRILGFVNAVVLAHTLGLVGAGADAFALANQLPNNIYAIVAGGVFSATLVPAIVKSTIHHDGGRAYVNKLVTAALSYSGIVFSSGIGIAFLGDTVGWASGVGMVLIVASGILAVHLQPAGRKEPVTVVTND